MAKRHPNSARPRKSALMRWIYLAVIFGIVAIFAIVTLEPIVAILRDAF